MLREAKFWLQVEGHKVNILCVTWKYFLQERTNCLFHSLFKIHLSAISDMLICIKIQNLRRYIIISRAQVQVPELKMPPGASRLLSFPLKRRDVSRWRLTDSGAREDKVLLCKIQSLTLLPDGKQFILNTQSMRWQFLLLW